MWLGLGSAWDALELHLRMTTRVRLVQGWVRRACAPFQHYCEAF